MSAEFENKVADDNFRKLDESGDGLVMVGRFLDPLEAQMAKGMLESVGIECFLEGANANAMVPLAFRVRLKVRRSDEAAARELMEETAIEERHGE